MPSTAKKNSKLKPLPPSIQRLRGRSGLSTPSNEQALQTITPKAKASSTKTPGGAFRMNVRNFALTFPQCVTSKEEAMERITKSRFGVKGALVVQENHADGTPHLHIALFLTDKYNCRDPHAFDFIAGKHGNMKVMDNPPGWITYLTKFDKAPLSYGIVPQPSSKASSTSKSEIVAKLVASGCNLEQVLSAQPGYTFSNKKKVEEWIAWYSLKRVRDSVKPLKLPIQYTGVEPTTQIIIDWLNMNLLTSRPFKQKQLYLSSPPNHLKTTLIRKLSTYLRIYVMPTQEDFYDFYNDDEYDLVVMDEFRGQKTVQFLNAWLQGDAMVIRKKGSQGMKNTNLPMIILSNYALPDVYTKVTPDKLNSLQVRLEEISLIVPLDLDNMVLQEKEKEPPQLPGMVAPSKGDKEEEEEMNLCVSDDE